MIKRSLLLTAWLVVFFAFNVEAQEKGGWFKGIFASGKKNSKSAETVEIAPFVFTLSDNHFRVDFHFLDSLFAAEEEANRNAQGGPSTPPIILSYGQEVVVDGNLTLDSVWLTLEDYYNIWDSERVNPYKFNGLEFKDTVQLTLFYPEMGLRWSSPMKPSVVTSNFGLRRYRWHYGVDLRLNTGDTITAAFDGVVRMANYDRYGYGHYVLIRHYNGVETLYGHLSKRLVQVGQEVKAGELIGLGGSTGRSTGPHLHFEVRYQGNAIDPNEFFDFATGCLVDHQYTLTPASFSYLAEVNKVVVHRVRRGDTLSGISYRYGVPISKICQLNGISKKSILRIGQRLRIN